MNFFGFKFSVLIALSAFSLAATSGPPKNLVDGSYVSPLGNFSVPAPAWKALRVQEHNDEDFMIVAFLDKDNLMPASMWSVASLRLSPDMIPEVARPEKRDEIYQRFLSGFALPYIFQNVAPAATLSNGAFLGEGEDRALFAVVNIPEGHTYLRNPKKKKQDDSVSGLLVYHHGPFMYLIRQEMKSILKPEVAPATLTNKDLEEAQSKLFSIKRTMRYAGDEPAVETS